MRAMTVLQSSLAMRTLRVGSLSPSACRCPAQRPASRLYQRGIAPHHRASRGTHALHIGSRCHRGPRRLGGGGIQRAQRWHERHRDHHQQRARSGRRPFGRVIPPASGVEGEEGYVPACPGGLGEEDFVTLVLPYIKSAREGSSVWAPCSRNTVPMR